MATVVAAALTLACGATSVVVLGAAPARANVTSITPPSATVDAGGGASATVDLDTTTTVCPDVLASHATITASINPPCEGGKWTARLSVSSKPDTPPGTYTVTVDDHDAAKSFRLTVRGAATTTSSKPTTTTTPTTLQPTTTTSRATTTVATAAPPATTAAPSAPDAFASIDALVARGLPATGMFLPLLSDTFTNCLPLTRPCVDPASGLMLLPARRSRVTWAVARDASKTSPLLDLSDLPLLQPIGARPPKPNESTFLLNVLDLASGGALRSFARTLDAGGQFAAPADPNALTLTTASSLVPTIEGANTLPVSSGIATGQPFGPPAKMTTTALPEASPVIVAFASSPAKLLYALRANPEWNLGTAFVPLLGNGHVPYLVRGPTGPAGLLLAAPPGAVLAPAVPAASARPAGTRRASIGVFALIGLAIVGGGAAAAVVSRRRNPRFGR